MPRPGFSRRTLASLAALLLAAGCATKLREVAHPAPAGPRMCGFIGRQELVDLVGPLRDVNPGDHTVHGSCGWRVRDMRTHPLDNFNGEVIWQTTKSVAQDTAGVPYTPITVHGHPGMFGQARGTTLLFMSTGGDINLNGELSVHLFTGRAGAKDVALTLTAAALAYVDAHSGTPS